ncbi:MAG: 2-oxoacid:ferredoxin oxidoreductase subunit beta [Planctomycetota bacterium]
MTATEPLQAKDFKTDQEVRWCPGCGDYGILSSVQKAFAALGKRPDQTAIISGIGCSSRFPYYMDTYGFHTIHGRALSVATGVKVANPELDVWVITGDGDALSIGGNHFIHTLRRNVGIKVLLFNNRIYGLTKGQYSPTSERGKKTKSTPMGSVDNPFRPISLALGARATFVARSIDVFGAHLEAMIRAASAHEGTAFVEIYQNCNIFNDGAFKSFTDKPVRDERVLQLEQDKPLVFGKDRNQAIRLDGDLRPEIVTLGEGGVTEADVLSWDEAAENLALPLALSEMPEDTFPVPIGIFHRRGRATFESGVQEQLQAARQGRGDESLDALLQRGETWVVGD